MTVERDRTTPRESNGSARIASDADRVAGSELNRLPAPDFVRHHERQRLVSRVLGPVWIGLTVLVMRFWFRYSIPDAERARREYRRIRAETDGPLLVCANHLTLVDSFLVAWALGSGFYWLRHPDELPWNTPERTNFGRTALQRLLIFVAKCIPITRGGSREEVREVLERVKYLLAQGETALIFPEAGRSRSGRVEEGAPAWGVGRIVGALPGCRVLCVYLRGRSQTTWSDYPARGDAMEVAIRCIEPKSDAKGARRSRDLAGQIVRQLALMEAAYFETHAENRAEGGGSDAARAGGEADDRQ